MLKHDHSLILLALAFSLPAHAESSGISPVVARTDQQKTPAYGENPNLFRVLTYKTGQAMSRLGGAIERSADETSAYMSEKWQDNGAYNSRSSQGAEKEKTQAVASPSQKEQNTGTVIMRRTRNIPVERGSLSQSATPSTPVHQKTTGLPSSTSSVPSGSDRSSSANP